MDTGRNVFPSEAVSSTAENNRPDAPSVSVDTKTFAQVVQEHQAFVARLAQRLLGPGHDVDDAVQEVFVAALKNIKKFRREAEIGTWLTRIAINRCRMVLRREERRRRWFGWLQKNVKTVYYPQASSFLVEAVSAVREAVYRLPEKYRTSIVLHYFEQMPREEVARLLKISTGALDVRLHRARQRLREFLSAQE